MKDFIRLLALCGMFTLLGACANKPANPRALRMTPPVDILGDPKMEFDADLDNKKPTNFRKSDELKMSASGIFSAKGAKYLAKLSPVVTVFDLRQEAHGFVNDLPVTWASEKYWANANLGHDESLRREKRYLSSLHIGERVTKSDGKKIKIKSVETEESLIRGLSQMYVRLTVSEGIRPSDDEVDRFIDAIHDLPLESWAHFHDLSGRGRSTVFMIMYDMLRHAEGHSFDEIIKRNSQLSEDNVLFISAAGDWRQPYQQDLVAFLKEFYNYAKAHPNGEEVFWTQWVKQ